jgi:hypothetical protein
MELTAVSQSLVSYVPFAFSPYWIAKFAWECPCEVIHDSEPIHVASTTATNQVYEVICPNTGERYTVRVIWKRES